MLPLYLKGYVHDDHLRAGRRAWVLGEKLGSSKVYGLGLRVYGVRGFFFRIYVSPSLTPLSAVQRVIRACRANGITSVQNILLYRLRIS